MNISQLIGSEGVMLGLIVERKMASTRVRWINHIHRIFGVLLLLLAAMLTLDSQRVTLMSVLEAEHGINADWLPPLFALFGLGLLFNPWRVRVHQLFFWLLPLELYVVALFYLNGPPVTALIYVHGVVSLFVIMALVEIIERMASDGNHGSS